MKKAPIIIAFLLGVGIATLFLFGQIQNRYDMGVNAGRLTGGFEVINFLKENLHNETDRTIIPLEKHLDFKDARISIVEIDGVATISIQ